MSLSSTSSLLQQKQTQKISTLLLSKFKCPNRTRRGLPSVALPRMTTTKNRNPKIWNHIQESRPPPHSYLKSDLKNSYLVSTSVATLTASPLPTTPPHHRCVTPLHFSIPPPYNDTAQNGYVFSVLVKLKLYPLNNLHIQVEIETFYL